MYSQVSLSPQQTPLMFTLPRQGPFRIRSSFVPWTLLKGILWFLFLGLVGGGLGGYGIYQMGNMLQTARIWNKGIVAPHAGYRGRVTTTNLIFKSYDLTLRYRTQKGRFIKSKVEFYRFFTGPSKGDPYKVRYLPEDPKKAMISWGYEARIHGWIFALLMLAIGLLVLYGAVILLRTHIKDITTLRRLARQGELIAAPIVDFQEVKGEGKRPEHLYTYSFTREEEYFGTYKATSPKERPLLAEDDTALVILASRHGSEHWVLRHNGHPLVL